MKPITIGVVAINLMVTKSCTFRGRELFVADDGEIVGYNNNIFESGKLLIQSEKIILVFL